MSDNLLIHYIIRVPKEESAFTYFTLEANEGLSFYSTLPSKPEDGFRDIEIKSHKSLENEIAHLIKELGKKFPLEIRTFNILEDQ